MTSTFNRKTTPALFTLIIGIISLLTTRCAQDNVFDDGDTFVIDSIAPSAGLPGSTFRIYGRGFSLNTTENEVTLNGLDVEISESSVGILLATVPAQATTGPVGIKKGNQTIQGPVFTIVTPPAITSLSPTQGIAGYTVTLNGSDLAQVQSVLFNGVPAVIVEKTETMIRVTAPSSTTGMVSVVYPYGQVSGPVFTYLPIPMIQTIDHFIGRLSYFIISATNVNTNPATLKVYMRNNEVPVLEHNLTNNPALIAIYASGESDPNPNEVIVESLGIKSDPYVVTITPIIDDFYLEDLTGNQQTTRYYFNIAGRYFGNPGTDRSVQLRLSSSNTVLATGTITTWAPRSITGEFSFNFPNFGPNDYFAMSVVVNGVKSNEVLFRMD
jgi:hypothetical protein